MGTGNNQQSDIYSIWRYFRNSTFFRRRPKPISYKQSPTTSPWYNNISPTTKKPAYPQLSTTQLQQHLKCWRTKQQSLLQMRRKLSKPTRPNRRCLCKIPNNSSFHHPKTKQQYLQHVLRHPLRWLRLWHQKTTISYPRQNMWNVHSAQWRNLTK